MRRFEHVRSVTVWLMLLGFLCGMLVPAVAMAKVHREIEMEGDPEDGLERAGGTTSQLTEQTEPLDGMDMGFCIPVFSLGYFMIVGPEPFVSSWEFVEIRIPGDSKTVRRVVGGKK